MTMGQDGRPEDSFGLPRLCRTAFREHGGGAGEQATKTPGKCRIVMAFMGKHAVGKR